MPFLSQITDLLGNTIVSGNTIQINLWNIFCRKLQGTEVAKNKWQKKKKNYPRNMIILCNHRYSRSLKLTPDHNRAAQWNSMGDMLFIFFPQCFTQDLLIAYALWHLIDYFRQISTHRTKHCRNPVSSMLIFETVNSSPSPTGWWHCKAHHWHTVKHHQVWEELPDGVVAHCYVSPYFRVQTRFRPW